MKCKKFNVNINRANKKSEYQSDSNWDDRERQMAERDENSAIAND